VLDRASVWENRHSGLTGELARQRIADLHAERTGGGRPVASASAPPRRGSSSCLPANPDGRRGEWGPGRRSRRRTRRRPKWKETP
jgi:hypothetical protein